MKVLIFGPESSGSALITRIVARALGLESTGYGITQNGIHQVQHTSLPTAGQWPPIEEWVQEATHVIICTRDQTISEISKTRRWKKNKARSRTEMSKAAAIIREVIWSDANFYIWSYETFMLLGDIYLLLLMEWLGLDPVPCEELIDGNKKYIK